MTIKNSTLCVLGLGYVGLPLAVEFSKKFRTIGFDINEKRVKELESGEDHTLECSKQQLAEAKIEYTAKLEDTRIADIYIITAPTPVDKHKRPDLTPVLNACVSVGKVLSKGNIVIFESTVYPGATEEDCVPVIEKASGLKFNIDFFCGFSPERINPGDKEHTVTKIKKVTSGSTPETAKIVDDLYKEIIVAGTFLASSIRVAEAAKVIENSQRDINIAFVNELALIFNRLGIDTMDVLEAAGTKWNFLPFKPGLVGGHCIGVDPYYLTHKAQEMGYHPEILLAGRRLNDNMGIYVAKEMIKLMIKKGKKIEGSNVLILGITFKENCPDIRNTRVVDIIGELKDFGCNVDIYDPWADGEEVIEEYGIELVKDAFSGKKYDSVLLAVQHEEFRNFDFDKVKSENCVVYDLKSFVDRSKVDGRL